MRSIAARALLGLVVATAVPLVAAAALIVPVSQAHSVSSATDGDPPNPCSASSSANYLSPGGLTVGCGSGHPNHPGFGVTSSVTQKSLFITDGNLYVENTGLSYAYGYGQGSLDSVFDMTFLLTQRSKYSVFQLNAAYTGSHQVTLTDASGGVIPGRTGVLPAGTYRFQDVVHVNAYASNGAEGSFQFWAQLGFTPIPEPQTALLLALGLGLLAARRHRSAS